MFRVRTFREIIESFVTEALHRDDFITFFSNSKQTNKKITPWYYTNVECHAVSEYQQNLLFTFFQFFYCLHRME